MSFRGSVVRIFHTRIWMTAVSFIIGVIMARALGVQGIGVLSLVILVVGFARMFADCGIKIALMNFIHKGSYKEREIIENAMTITIVAGIFATIISVGIFDLVNDRVLSGLPFSLFCWALPMIVLGGADRDA